MNKNVQQQHSRDVQQQYVSSNMQTLLYFCIVLGFYKIVTNTSDVSSTVSG